MLARMTIKFASRIHTGVTETAILKAGLNLPMLPSAVVAVDYELANIPCNLGKVTREGQKHHFMLAQGLSQQDSLKECLEWIKTNTRDAVRSIAHWPGGVEGAATPRGFV